MILASLLLSSFGLAGLEPDLRGRLEVSRGRAILATDGGLQPLGRRDGSQLLAGPGHLELAPGSRAELGFSGLGSLRLEGPASVAWQVIEGSAPWQLEFNALTRVELEVRREPLRVDLPGDWRLGLEPGAYSLAGLPGGGTDFQHLAGRPARAIWTGESNYAPGPRLLGAGESARLQGGLATPAPEDPSVDAPSWGASRWPWGRGAIEDVPDLPPGWGHAWRGQHWPWAPADASPDSWRAWDWPWDEQAAGALTPLTPSWNSWKWPWGAPVEPPGTATELEGSSAEPQTQAPAGPEGALEELRPEAAAEEDWQGLDEWQLRRWEHFAVERSEFVSVEAVRGGWRIACSLAAPGPSWCFSDRLDVELSAGSSLVIDDGGRVLYHTGSVRILKWGKAQ